MTLYRQSRHPAWYRAVQREVFRRAHWICEFPGCGMWATHTHHLCYPQGRREEPRDLMAVCAGHHDWLHGLDRPAANDNEEAEQFALELTLPANDNVPLSAQAGQNDRGKYNRKRDSA